MQLQNLVLVFGAYNFDNLSESDTYSTSPSEIIVHPDWNPRSDNWDADIAVLLTDKTIPLTNFINPICLMDRLVEPDISEGYITGWGKSSTSVGIYEPMPKQMEISIKDQVDCLLENPLFAKMSSRRTFCGRSRDGSGPCLGKLY